MPLMNDSIIPAMPAKGLPPDTRPRALEFTFATLSEARQALEEPPAGVAALRRAAGAEWVRKRRVLTEGERRLTRAATQWMLSLPADARPIELLRRFARIANELAAGWCDVALTARRLDELVLDRRGGRQGFPPQIAGELIRLQEHFQRQLRLQRRRG